MRAYLTPLLILLVTAAGVAAGIFAEGYWHFILALVALTTITGVGLNILLGLTGQVSLGHVGFYSIGAYTAAILTLKGVDFWIAFPIAGLLAGIVGGLLALPALRVTGPYLAMVTIAFAFIVEHSTIEWRSLTGGQNGLMGIVPPSIGSHTFTERDIAIMAVLCAGLAMAFFHRLASSAWGKGMLAVRDAEIAARSIGLNPVIVKTVSFALSAVLTGLAGAMFAPLLMFVAPSNFPFSQSILFLLAVIVGGAGWTLGPVVGAAISVVLPEMLSGLAEYRLLFFGGLLLVVLWLAPDGVIGTLATLWRKVDPRSASSGGFDLAAFLSPEAARRLEVRDIGIAFGGIRAASDVSFNAKPGQVTSVIGPNGAGKTTVLNIIGGFYRADEGSVRLGDADLTGAPAWKVARAGIARTYQTTKLFGTLSVIDNVRIALRRGRLGVMLMDADAAEEKRAAEALLAFVGYFGPLATPADDLPHVDRRLVEIARALACRPDVLLLDEPAAGLMRADKDQLSKLLRRIADLGISVILVEHDMTLVMGISDHIVVLDAGTVIAQGTPAEVRHNSRVLKAYLGGGDMRERPRKEAFEPSADAILSTVKLTAGYGAAPVVEDVTFDVRPGEMVAMLGANGAGKSTIMRALSGLLRPVRGNIVLDNKPVTTLEAYRIAHSGLALVPEGRQVFGELDVRDNLVLGAFSRKDVDIDKEIEALLDRFPRLRERLSSRAGLLSGGEQQMLAIARGLMANPRVLLLDEPSLGLAPAMINELFDILAELRDEGVTILLVDQMAALALTVADRGYVLESGRVVHADNAASLASDPALEAAYLGRAEAAQ
ncbi:branched-chain amino acid ABC transporter ATP-binding protein/permease [Pseudorhodoplanes sp.]|uniref:branched-chain amino acid ABC transporter ATP-binding protein/permease n=1 Tax=Pseudorhodoplanes sp. TaxID=1934341 RepID=UPI002B6DFB3C|nr:branched-chain amino acid ABC transporter ATP-binding protein/permease [Pseudorhodoplanes sp.]HWV54203.1 branched-chain amino acid ABC transporter ATP-binding protein/permease [Pseudorhodoplanes sp.]